MKNLPDGQVEYLCFHTGITVLFLCFSKSIAYKAENGEIKDIKLRFLDKDFNIVDEASLMQYIKPDFARLTDIGPSEDTDEDAKPDKKGLVAIKSGIKPKLREIEKKA